MVAGPSEVSIVADKFADPELVAADLIAQAEHDIYAQSILITNSSKLIYLVKISGIYTAYAKKQIFNRKHLSDFCF